MSDLTFLRDASYGRYEHLLLERDRLYRECESIALVYTRTFGQMETDVFEEKIACIRQKKAIAFCQTAINRGQRVNLNDLDDYLARSMALYQSQLEQLVRKNRAAQEAVQLSHADIERAKVIYRRIAKKLHPDINPYTAQEEQLSELWNRVAAAYRASNALELGELEVLVNRALEQLGLAGMEIEIPDIEDRISRLEEEIENILTTTPYTWGVLLDDPQAVEEKKQKLTQELDEYKQYHAQLDEALRRLTAQGGAQFEWKTD